MEYDHRRHAGNAGDLWKHLILAEVADHLLEAGIQIYVESHAGYPEYILSPGGEWEGGVGRLWPLREGMARYSYFQILRNLNPAEIERYPGSASIVLELAKRRGLDIRAELWDKSSEVEKAWRSGKKCRGLEDPHFHLGDGFSGAGRLADQLYEPALLLVDSPYIERGDAALARELISRSAAAGWVALSWQPMGLEMSPRPPCELREFALRFEEAGLVCGPMEGAMMILAWDEGAFPARKVDDLIERLEGMEKEFPRIATLMSESF
jgi:23S rRNA (adenine2030-N6)-methyltransferase